MSLSIIGAGFGRTGTLSLKQALERLGFGPCHHMEEVLKTPSQLPLWQAAVAGQAVDWDEVFAGYGAMVDWPGSHYWRQLAAAYPQARVILSVRPEESWWASYAKTIMALLEMRQDVPNPYVRGVLEMAHAIIAEQTFNAPPGDREAALSAYRQRTEDVKAAIPADRLLVFDVAEGWAPLCAFLGAAVPDAPFPRTNSADEFWELVRGAA
ncbi:sulfotransferase family protein [Limobrevibacterium gyesilva]|uniref:Sulfotransferase family protein n=1 Tax=Limobrevibacterium gyesilva TaxID=2991712 RepID=A0AA41YIE5_9PROT|nr:sulfotransferase family protein [Limobrevibacterium gyesilva]MCW3473589.1 hypothetical protein [Limobrevibacterium gyesilva]